MSVRILYTDIESRPILGYTFGLWNQNIGLNQILEDDDMLSFSAKWRGGKKEFRSVYHDGKDTMVQRAWDLLDQAQIIVTWNGRRFDEPWFKRMFIEAGMTPPSPFKHLDLYQVAKGQFRWPSHKLAYVSQRLCSSAKLDSGGFELWRSCMAGDPKAWARMKKYNLQDSVVLEELHTQFLPWINNHPHMGLLDGREDDCCQNCGSDNLQRRGFAYTPLGKFQSYRCNDCGTWSRGKKALATVDVRAVGR